MPFRTRLVFMRHGETEWNIEKRIQGCKDVPLNARGLRQIEEVSNYFLHHSTFQFSRIMSSPLLRAKQSAMICSRVLHIPVGWVPEFSERRFGMLEGRTREEIHDQYDITDIEDIEDSRYGIEPASSVWERVRRGLYQLNCHQESLLLVTHGSIIKLIARQHGMQIGIINNAAYLELDPVLAIYNGREMT